MILSNSHHKEGSPALLLLGMTNLLFVHVNKQNTYLHLNLLVEYYFFLYLCFYVFMYVETGSHFVVQVVLKTHDLPDSAS
jgi:hypothetical protein